MIPDNLKGRRVVVDTDTSYIVVGTLIGEQNDFVVLDEVDLHDQKNANTHQDLYLSDVSENGVQINRKKIYLYKNRVVSFTELDDVVSY